MGYDESNKSPDESIQEILRRSSHLPSEEVSCREEVRAIGLLFRSLLMDAIMEDPETIDRWIDILHDTPSLIGIHPEFCNETQRIIDGIRNSIEEMIDVTLPQMAQNQRWLAAEEDFPISLEEYKGAPIVIILDERSSEFPRRKRKI